MAVAALPLPGNTTPQSRLWTASSILRGILKMVEGTHGEVCLASYGLLFTFWRPAILQETSPPLGRARFMGFAVICSLSAGPCTPSTGATAHVKRCCPASAAACTALCTDKQAMVTMTQLAHFGANWSVERRAPVLQACMTSLHCSIQGTILAKGSCEPCSLIVNAHKLQIPSAKWYNVVFGSYALSHSQGNFQFRTSKALAPQDDD